MFDARKLRARERQARCAQRRPGVVGDLARPDEVPQRLAQRLRRSVELGEQVGEERGPCASRARRSSCSGPAGGSAPARAAGRPDRGRVLAEVQRDAPRATERTGTDPHDLAARAEAVEPGLRVGAGAPRQHVALPDLHGQREALQRHEHLAQAIDPGAGARVAVHALPRGQERGEAPLVGRLDLLAQRGQRRAPQPSQHLYVAPLALAYLRDAAHRGRARRRARARAARSSRRRRSARAARRCVNGPWRARVARDELAAARRARRRGTPPAGRRAAWRRARRGRGPPRRRRSQRSSPPTRRRTARRSRSQLARAAPSASTPANTRSADLSASEVADVTQHVVQAVAAGGARHLGAVLQVVFDARERARVDQLAQLLLAEQLAQQIAVERQRGGTALGVGRVALVHVGGDVVEQQRGGKRRGGLRLDLDERDLTRGAGRAAAPAGQARRARRCRHSR